MFTLFLPTFADLNNWIFFLAIFAVVVVVLLAAWWALERLEPLRQVRVIQRSAARERRRRQQLGAVVIGRIGSTR